jgi:hypothetical protein
VGGRGVVVVCSWGGRGCSWALGGGRGVVVGGRECSWVVLGGRGVV